MSDKHSENPCDCKSTELPCAKEGDKIGLFQRARWCGRVHKHGTPIGVWAGEVVWSIRWTMVPMYLLLLVTMSGYAAFFTKNLFEFFFTKDSDGATSFAPFEFLMHSGEEWLLFILNQLDITMIGMLTVIICKGGYAIFVQDFGGVPKNNRPSWMGHLDVNMLKVKMCMSLASVSGVHLLKSFVNISERHAVDWPVLGAQLAIHGMFLASVLIFQLNDILFAFATKGASVTHGHDHAPAPSHSGSTTPHAPAAH